MPTSVYRAAARLAYRLALPRSKLAQSLAGRRAAVERWRRWGETERPPGPLVWVHAASVGEAQVAAPVVTRLRAGCGCGAIVLSCSSPSLARWPDTFGAAHLDYLPPDEPRAVRAVLEALRPSLLAFARGDLWPELAAEAVERGVPLAVFGGTVSPGSLRLSWPARRILAPTVAAASWIGAVSSAHAARWIALGARPESVEVTGDPRHDAVVERVTRLDAIAPLRAWAAGRVVLVAGSLEPDDLEPVLFAIRALLAAHERAAAVLVPHDPAPATVARWVEATRAAALHPAPWAPGLAVPAGRCVVLAAAGMLADLYLLADLAYVGGGFRRGRLHTVLEPAALAVPVMVGPGYGSDDAAAAILRAGGGFALPRRGAGPALWEVCRPLVEDPHVRTAAGLAARGALHQGAASRTARALAQLMGVVSSPFSTRFDARLNLS